MSTGHDYTGVIVCMPFLKCLCGEEYQAAEQKRLDVTEWEDGEMGIVEILIMGLVFVALGGCLVYSIVSNGK